MRVGTGLGCLGTITGRQIELSSVVRRMRQRPEIGARYFLISVSSFFGFVVQGDGKCKLGRVRWRSTDCGLCEDPSSSRTQQLWTVQLTGSAEAQDR